jgi:hypothetical protein
MGDQPTPATGTVLRYTVMGLEYQGIPLRASNTFKSLLWSNASLPGIGDGVVVIPKPGEPLPRPPGPLRTHCPLHAPELGRLQPPPNTWCSPCLGADPALIPGMPNKIAGGGICRIDSTASYVYCPTPGGNGSTAPEQFVPVRPDGGSDPIVPGQPTFLKSKETGK